MYLYIVLLYSLFCYSGWGIAVAFRYINGDFYVALGSSMGLALLVCQGRWSVKAGFKLFW